MPAHREYTLNEVAQTDGRSDININYNANNNNNIKTNTNINSNNTNTAARLHSQ
jgi:hypothetical protein